MKKTLLLLVAALTLGLASNAQVTTFPWTEDFEGGSTPTGFTFYDNDGDGNNWIYHLNGSGNNFSTHSGNGIMTSASYSNGALTPDNWMVLPAMTLPASATDFNLSWWAVGQDPSYAAEYYSVYIATGNTIADFTATNAVYNGTSTATYAKNTVNLSSYAGQTIYIAFRHWNVTDMFYLNIDDIRVGAAEMPTVTLAGPSSAALNVPVTYTATSDATSFAWSIDGVQQSSTTNTLTHTFTATGTYTVTVTATNAAGSVSENITTTVVDGVVNSFPWTEDFESITLGSDGFGETPAGWIVYADNNANYSNYAVFGQGWVVANMGAGASAYSTSYLTSSSAVCDRWLVTPKLNMPSATGYFLEFDLFGQSNSYPESLKVMVSTTDASKTSFTTTIFDEATVAAGTNHKMIDLSAFAGQSIYIAFINYGSNGYYVGIDNVKVSIPNPHGIAYAGGQVRKYAPMGSNFDFYTAVMNRGTNPLTSYTLTYTINNGTPQTRTVNGINVAPYDYYIDTITISHASTGTVSIGLEVSAPNGQNDPDPTDNTGNLSLTIYDPATATERTALIEHFTTAVCPNCPAGHARVENGIRGREDNVVWIAHHVGYYTDDMTINESNQMLAFFNDGGETYAPAVMIDRNRNNATSEDPGPVFFPGSDFGAVLNNALDLTYVNVDLTNVYYNAATRELTATVSGSFMRDMTFDSPRISLYIMEDGIQGTQSGASGTYTHNHVIRACISDVWGDAGAITSTNAGATFSKTYTYTVPGNFDASKCWIAGFVSNYTSDINSRQVANAAKTGYLTTYNTPVSITDVESSIKVVSYPNPAAEMVYVTLDGKIRSYRMVDALGREVLSGENLSADILELDVRHLPQGLYLINVTSDLGVATQRVSIVR